MCSYLYRRGAVYCTWLAVPVRLRQIIGRSDLGRSLGTKELADAKRLLPSWLEEAQSIIAAAERQLLPTPAPIASYPFTREQADWEAEQDHLRLEFDWEQDAKDDAAEAFELRIKRPHAELTTDEASAGRLLSAAKLERDRYRERYQRRKQSDQRGLETNKRQPGFWVSPAAASTGTMLDGTIVDLWAAERKPNQKGIDAHRSVASWFYERVGQKPVDKITRQDVLAFKSKLLADGQSAANIKVKLSRLRTLLQWAADNGYPSRLG